MPRSNTVLRSMASVDELQASQSSKRKFKFMDTNKAFYCVEFTDTNQIQFVRFEWLQEVLENGTAKTKFPKDKDYNRLKSVLSADSVIAKWMEYSCKIVCKGHGKF